MSTHLPERFHPLRSHSSTSTSIHEGSREGSREESREGCVPFILKQPHFRCIRFFTDVSQFFYLSTGILGMCNLTLPIRKLLHGIWCHKTRHISTEQIEPVYAGMDQGGRSLCSASVIPGNRWSDR